MAKRQSRTWLNGTLTRYDLTTELQSVTERDGRNVARVHVAGNFPGSPYAFDYEFAIHEDRIAELVIDPVGPVSG